VPISRNNNWKHKSEETIAIKTCTTCDYNGFNYKNCVKYQTISGSNCFFKPKESHMEQQKMVKGISTFFFNEEYAQNGKLGTASVKLEIDYQLKTFSIFPGDKKIYRDNIGGSTLYFKFIENSNIHYNEWKAVLKCITNALDFANKELGVE
jgi:hypothetical protein